MFKLALIDVVYMMIFALALGYFIQNDFEIVNSFGFSYQPIFIQLFVFYSIWIELPDLILRLGINWSQITIEYSADQYAVKQGYGEELEKALLTLFASNDDHYNLDPVWVIFNK